MEIREANISVLNDDEIEITLDLSQSKRFRNEEKFDYETIDAELFIKSLDNAPLILNHRKEKIVSDDMKLRAEGDKVIITAKLDQKNPYASYVLSLREHSSSRLGCSFGFIAIKDEVRNRLRTVKELIVKEISVLTNVEPAYHSSIRCYDDTEVREISIDELKELINKSVAEALKPKENEQKIDEKPQEVEPKIEEKPVQVEPKEVKINVNTDDFKAVFDGFLAEFKEILPKNEPKKEEKLEEKPVEEVQKVEEEQEEKPQIDNEQVQKDIESYKKMLAEMEE